MKRPLATALIVAAVLIHASFYASALHFDFWEYFFPRGAVHGRQGLDFFQVPNAARAYWEGYSLSGRSRGAPRYADGNYNVFHPFFTIVVGTPLQWLSPRAAYATWLAIHALVKLGMAMALVRRFRAHPDLPLALFLLLACVPEALEIWNGQYHFLLAAGVFWLMLRAREPERPIFDGAVLAGTLLVKPITLLWIPTLLWKRRWWTLVVALLIMEVTTLPFLLDGSGRYYWANVERRTTGAPGLMTQLYALDGLLLLLRIPWRLLRVLEIATAAGIFAAQWFRRLDLYRSFFLWTAFQLLFDYSFEYHYSILAPVLAVGVLTDPAFRSRGLRFCSLWMIAPTPFWLFHWLQIGAEGNSVSLSGWAVLVLWRVVPLIAAAALLITSAPVEEQIAPRQSPLAS